MQTSIDPQHVAIREPVRDSDVPVQLMYVDDPDAVQIRAVEDSIAFFDARMK